MSDTYTDLQRLIFDKNEEFFNAIVCGPQNTGKTFWVKSLLKKIYSTYDRVIIMAPHRNNDLLNLGIPNLQYAECSDESLEQIVSLAQEATNEGVMLKMLIVLDDYLSFISLTGKKAKPLIRLAASSRHIHCSCLFLSQSFSNNLPPVLRSSCSFIVVFPRLPSQQIEAIYPLLPLCEFRNSQSLFERYLMLPPFHFMFVDKTGLREKGLYFCTPLINGGPFRFHELEQPRDEDELRTTRELREYYKALKAARGQAREYENAREEFLEREGFDTRVRVVSENNKSRGVRKRQ